MSKISSIEQIEALFMPTAFEIVKNQHADIDDTETLFLAWEMLWSANDLYTQAIKDGKTESEAIFKASDIFFNTHQSVAS